MYQNVVSDKRWINADSYEYYTKRHPPSDCGKWTIDESMKVPQDKYVPDGTKYVRQTIKCPVCGYDSGLPEVFLMVIPPEGLKCPEGHIILAGNQVTM